MEPQIRDTDTWTDIVSLAERYDSTMYRNKAYGSDHPSGQSSRKQKHKQSTPSSQGSSSNQRNKKTPAKKGSSNKKTHAKPSKAEMDRRKRDGACFYCVDAGHMADACPQKEVRTNHVVIQDEDEDQLSSGIEEIYVGHVIISAKTTIGTGTKATPLQALEFDLEINGKKARALADTGTIGGSIISNHFVTTHGLPYLPQKAPKSLKMAVKGSRATSNHTCEVEAKIGKATIKVPMMVAPLADYDILLGLDTLCKLGAQIDCQNNTVFLPKHKVRVHCKGASAQPRSAMAVVSEIPDFPAEYPEVFVKEIPIQLPPLRKVQHRIMLKDPNKALRTPNDKTPESLLPRFREWIKRQLKAGSIYQSPTPGGSPMFVQGKVDGRIRPLVDLRARNDNTIKDHSPIPNQQLILNSVGRAKFRSKIDLSDA